MKTAKNKQKVAINAISKKEDRKKKSSLEVADAIYGLVKKGVKPTLISKKMKVSLPYVYNMMKLAKMSLEMRNMITSGKIKTTDAIKILSKTKSETEFIKKANKIAKSIKSSKKEAIVEVPAKRRGRPKKVSTTPVVATVDAPVQAPAEAPVKRRGRPRKNGGTSAPAPAKRPVGRPKKTSATPAEATVQAPAKRRGRPKKVAAPVVVATVQAPAKRRGRPKKVVAPVVAITANVETGVETPIKRRPGRPRKVQDPSIPAPAKRPVGRPRKKAVEQPAQTTKEIIISILKKEKSAKLKSQTVNSITNKILAAIK